MALAKMTDLQKLAMDCYEGKVKNYTNGNPEEVLRNEIVEKVGGEWNYYNFQKNHLVNAPVHYYIGMI